MCQATANRVCAFQCGYHGHDWYARALVGTSLRSRGVPFHGKLSKARQAFRYRGGDTLELDCGPEMLGTNLNRGAAGKTSGWCRAKPALKVRHDILLHCTIQFSYARVL